MSIFKIFSKQSEPKTNPPPENQESTLKLNYTSEQTGELDVLNPLIKNFKLDKKSFSSYDDYFENEKNIFFNKQKEKKVF